MWMICELSMAIENGSEGKPPQTFQPDCKRVGKNPNRGAISWTQLHCRPRQEQRWNAGALSHHMTFRQFHAEQDLPDSLF
jgi:hypothetical protein